MSASGEQRSVGGYFGQDPVEGLVLRCDAAHQRNDRFLVRHCCPHPGDAAEVAVEPLDPVRGVYHALYFRRIVEVGHVSLVVGIVPHALEVAVILASPVAQVLPPFSGVFHGIAALPGAEHVAEAVRQRGLVAMPYSGEHVALEVRHAALQRRSQGPLPYHQAEAGDFVGHHQAYVAHATLLQFAENLTPAGGVLGGHVEYAKHLPRAFFGHGKDDVERLGRHRLAAVDLDVDTVHEHYGVILLEAAL